MTTPTDFSTVIDAGPCPNYPKIQDSTHIMLKDTAKPQWADASGFIQIMQRSTSKPGTFKGST